MRTKQVNTSFMLISRGQRGHKQIDLSLSFKRRFRTGHLVPGGQHLLMPVGSQNGIRSLGL